MRSRWLVWGAALVFVALSCSGCDDQGEGTGEGTGEGFPTSEGFGEGKWINGSNGTCVNCADHCSCVVAGRPYIVHGESLVAEPTPAESAGAAVMPGASEWGCMRDANADDADVLKSLIMEALTRADQSADPWPELTGTLALQARLPQLLTAAHEALIDIPAEERSKWHSAGLVEHASVASFAKLGLELLVAGAPPSLVQLAIGAQEEELLHAQISLSLSGAGNGTCSSLQFPEHTLEIHRDLASLRSAAIREGLQGEGKSALELLGRSLDALGKKGNNEALPFGAQALSELLWAMGKDEARHAQLAAEVINWVDGKTKQQSLQVKVRNGEVHVFEI